MIKTNRLNSDTASQKVLEKAGFVPTGENGEEGLLYVVAVMKNGEHWFHTDEQMAFLDEWIMSKK